MPHFLSPRGQVTALALLTALPALLAFPTAAAQDVRSQSLVVNPVAGFGVGGLTLIDTDTGRPVPGYDPIPAGATLDLSRLPARLSLRANTSGPVGSVRFGLDANANYRVQGGAPYSLCNDQGGRYDPCPAPVFSPGEHRVTATPYSAAGASGQAGQALTLSYTVVRPTAAPRPGTPAAPADLAVTSLTLIDADTDRPVPGYDPIPAGARLRLSALPRHLNIRANVGRGVGSVRFVRDSDAPYVENEAPFAACTDTRFKNGQKGDYLPCNPRHFSLGTHRLTATPFSKMFAGGTSGQILTWDYTVER